MKLTMTVQAGDQGTYTQHEEGDYNTKDVQAFLERIGTILVQNSFIQIEISPNENMFIPTDQINWVKVTQS
jgi:methyl coenzyme M reductase subunit C-like uncharacterized protein (methanogenesis marker protein 7)